MLLDLADLALQEQPEDNLMVSISRGKKEKQDTYRCSRGMCWSMLAPGLNGYHANVNNQ